MARGVRGRFWFEVALFMAAAVLLVVTLTSREWIEAVFGVDPDAGSGALEWGIVAAVAVVAVVTALAARYEWRHRPVAAAPSTG
jgi:hypothetical protein